MPGEIDVTLAVRIAQTPIGLAVQVGTIGNDSRKETPRFLRETMSESEVEVFLKEWVFRTWLLAKVCQQNKRTIYDGQ